MRKTKTVTKEERAAIERIRQAIQAHEDKMLDPEYRALVKRVQGDVVFSKPVPKPKTCKNDHLWEGNRKPYSKSKPDGYTYCVPCREESARRRYATKVNKYDRLV